MKTLIIISFLTIALCASSFGQSTENKGKLIGKPAPALSLEKVLQGPASGKTSLKELKGKVIVLEFWATWCSPCLANIPHLNELSKYFEDKNVVFISITSESQEVIEKFLKKREMLSWVGLDTDKSASKAYGIAYIPRTFVIDSSGKLLFDGYPSSLNKEILKSILDNKYVPPVNTSTDANGSKLKYIGFSPGLDPLHYAFTQERADDLPLYLTIVRPAVFPSSPCPGGYGVRTTAEGGVGITIVNTPLLEIFSMAFNMPSYCRITNEAKIDEESGWDVVFSRRNGYESGRAWEEIRTILQDVFSVKPVKDKIKREVTVVTITNASQFIRKKDIDRNDPTSKSFVSIENLIARLERKSGEIYIFDGDKDLHIDCFGKTYETAKEIKNLLLSEGIVFHKEKRNVEVLKLLKK